MARGSEYDQADWNVCISWQRMFVACQTSGKSLRIPITLFLHEARPLVDRCNPRVSNRAHIELREAWRALEDENEWQACVLGCQARAIAASDPTPDRKALEGQALCILIRESYPKATPGFEKAGRLAGNRGEP
jgi:hypothetical protein